jgi:hypothetical protein
VSIPRYCYHGNNPAFYGRLADPVLRPDGKCIVGTRGGPHNRLIRWADTGELCVVTARAVRLVGKCPIHGNHRKGET